MRADTAEVWIAAMPPLHPRSMSATPPETDSLQIIHEYPLYRFRKSADRLSSCVGGITLVFHGREHSTHRQPLHIDILSNDRDQTLLTHFALVPAADSFGSQAEPTARCMLTGLGESPLRAVYSKSHSLHLEWTERGTVQSFVVEGNTLHVCLSDVDGETSESLSGVLATPGLPANEANMDFCSFSGRVCARVPLPENDGYKVVVMDYVRAKGTVPFA
ncbi:hypothetical protein DFH06DRAFT_185437 [Mycena polygramma]|nr:hypothetical protein DFH06DRAFT_185437 [Mycena polygramma]